MAEAKPTSRERKAKPDLRIWATLSVSWEVVARHWLTLGLLQVILGLSVDVVFWVIRGVSPTYVSLMPPAPRYGYMALTFVLTALYNLYATRITLADRLEGRKLKLRQAVDARLAVVGAALVATFVGYLPMWFSNTFLPIGQLDMNPYIAASLALCLAVSVFMAFIGAAVAVIADEGITNPVEAIVRAIAVTHSHWLGLTLTIFAFNAVWFLVQLGVSELSGMFVLRFTLRDDDILFWRAVVWEPFNILQTLLWPVWMSVLYIALRRAREGVASAGDIALFD